MLSFFFLFLFVVLIDLMLVLGFEFFIIKNWNFVILNIGGLLLMLLMFSSIEVVLD